MATVRTRETVRRRSTRAPRSAGEWRITTLTGLGLLVLLAIHMVANHFVVRSVGGLRDYRQVLAYIANPVIFTIESLFLLFVTVHAMFGLRIATAGGLEGTGEEHPVGTDAARILTALEQVWSDDGVLVLMDLGSAVLSAEMALEFLDPDRRAKVHLSGAPFVEGAVSAAVAAKLGRPLDAVAEEALGGLAGKRAHLGAGPQAEAGSLPGPEETPGPEVRLPIVIDLPHGLHARPAARLVQTAGAFDADIRVTNVTAGRGPVSARSLNAVATLGVTVGQRIEVEARGPQAELAIDAVRALADRRFVEAPDDLAITEPTAPESAPAVEGAIVGIPASPGIAVGPVRHLHVPELPVPDGAAGTPEEERSRLDAAIAAVRADITRQRAAAIVRVGAGE